MDVSMRHDEEIFETMGRLNAADLETRLALKHRPTKTKAKAMKVKKKKVTVIAALPRPLREDEAASLKPICKGRPKKSV